GVRGPLPQERSIITGDEAEFLTLRGIGRRELTGPRERPDLRLLHAADREARPRQLGLRERPDEIALVLLPVRPRSEEPALGGRIPVPTRIMPGRDGPGFPGEGAAQERAELDLPVTHDARAGRSPRAIFSGEVCDDRLGELPLVVEQVVGDAELAGHQAGPGGGGGRAARAEN